MYIRTEIPHAYIVFLKEIIEYRFYPEMVNHIVLELTPDTKVRITIAKASREVETYSLLSLLCLCIRIGRYENGCHHHE